MPALLLALGTGPSACSGGPPDSADADAEASDGYPNALLERSWPVVMTDNDARQPYEAGRGWVQLGSGRGWLRQEVRRSAR